VWRISVLEPVCGAFLTRVQALLDTARAMDAALRKRAARPHTAGLSDSDKILLQLFLDVRAFGEQVYYYYCLVKTF
jgi:hypothetical protein